MSPETSQKIFYWGVTSTQFAATIYETTRMKAGTFPTSEMPALLTIGGVIFLTNLLLNKLYRFPSFSILTSVPIGLVTGLELSKYMTDALQPIDIRVVGGAIALTLIANVLNRPKVEHI